MGVFYQTATVSNPQTPHRREAFKFLVDTGAFFTVVPRNHLSKLGIKPTREETVQFADGRKARWKVGEVYLRLDGRSTHTWVLFGKSGTQPLLGAYTLEGLGLTVDPRRKQLAPMPVVIVAGTSSAWY